MSINPNTPIWQLTVGQLTELLADQLEKIPPENKEQERNHRELVYGLAGIAKVLGISKTHVSRLKRQGILNEAITQRGRTIIADKDILLRIFEEQVP